jgi:hypothetical protein
MEIDQVQAVVEIGCDEGVKRQATFSPRRTSRPGHGAAHVSMRTTEVRVRFSVWYTSKSSAESSSARLPTGGRSVRRPGTHGCGSG